MIVYLEIFFTSASPAGFIERMRVGLELLADREYLGTRLTDYDYGRSPPLSCRHTPAECLSGDIPARLHTSAGDDAARPAAIAGERQRFLLFTMIT